jgi:predicted HAD superfamily Cof-like phosphohydrolase
MKAHTMTIQDTKRWFEIAIPAPTPQNVSVQIGCHMEEFAEMLTALGETTLAGSVDRVADMYKQAIYASPAINRVELLDALADQIVTVVGIGHMLGMDIAGALAEVNRSNFSKFIDGEPVFKENGKIGKSANYVPPDLTAFV